MKQRNNLDKRSKEAALKSVELLKDINSKLDHIIMLMKEDTHIDRHKGWSM